MVMSADNPRESQSLRAVTRTLDLLDAIAASKGSLDLTSLARESGLHPATALRYLNSLERRGLIRRDSRSGYDLGVKLFELGSSFAERNSILREVQGPIDDLAIKAQETASAGILDDGSVLYIAIANGQRELGIQSSAGTRHPAHCTALGKAILASLPWEHAAAVLAHRPLVPLEGPPPDVKNLRDELAKTRNRGYAVDDEERHEGVLCIGAPVFTHSGEVAGAVSISGPKFRIEGHSFDGMAGLVIETAAEISRRLGATASPSSGT
jgi:DNA-binding IclR family transcriptional regulator